MPVNPEYDREFSFNIDEYLVENYPSMNMATRRSVCALSFDWFDTEHLEDVVDEVVSDYAKTKLNISKKEIEEDDS
tara:strand:- start:757 stop:984 length:228 start_codon:yes stop_codon:yes gene_type:complete